MPAYMSVWSLPDTKHGIEFVFEPTRTVCQDVGVHLPFGAATNQVHFDLSQLLSTGFRLFSKVMCWRTTQSEINAATHTHTHSLILSLTASFLMVVCVEP
jgi:hypothetical protein